MMHVAIYARVSTERQERQQTVEGQLHALRAWVQAQGHTLLPEHVYTDEGYTGSRLDRPGLDGLRDAVQDTRVEGVAVLSPDRLTRKYAYQVLLLEEFRRAGCAVFFVQHPIGDGPDDQLLLQIQGAVAEYERALLGERFRRGTLQHARRGHSLSSKPPYGYRYVPKHESTPGYLVVDEGEAEVVRALYRWLIEEQMTIRQILKRLQAGPWVPRSGRGHWWASVVHHILADPVYAGTAYANRYRTVPPRQPRPGGTPAAPRGPRTAAASSSRRRPPEEWIPVPVPALVDEATFARAQAQLARNAALSFRHNTKHTYLLRCLLTCGVCGWAMFGVTAPATAAQPARCAYRCHGKDCVLSNRERACPRRAVKAAALETAVWQHVTELLREPRRLLAQFQAVGQATLDGGAHEQAERRRLEARLARLAREDGRLLDAYQAEVLSLEELAPRRAQLAQRRRALVEQRTQWDRLRQERRYAQEVLHDLTAFCMRIQTRLAGVTLQAQQHIL